LVFYTKLITTHSARKFYSRHAFYGLLERQTHNNLTAVRKCRLLLFGLLVLPS